MEKPKSTSKQNDHAWQALEEHHPSIANRHIRDLFDKDPNRAENFSFQFGDIFIDYSKHRITEETIKLLVCLAESKKVKEKINDLFNGKKINLTEDRAALHTALRVPKASAIKIEDSSIASQVRQELEKIRQFAYQMQTGKIKGSSGKVINKITNIGIGGSDLGPRLVMEALHQWSNKDITFDFVANLDANDIDASLKNSDPETTLFIVTSKSFTTLETLTNAETAKQWLLDNDCTDIARHFVAVSANTQATSKFGITEDHIFDMWDWVGGRYSVWSAVGLSIAVGLGMDHFEDFLSGAHEMDLHFLSEAERQNIPIILALLDIWYNNFFHAETLAIIPYDQRLQRLPDYLSQLIMESNGKEVSTKNTLLDYDSSQIIWGSVGTNAQHAFFQMLHQGTRLVPVEFLLPIQSTLSLTHHKLVANCVAQSKALMLGQENVNEPYRNFSGNRPSTTICYRRLSPRILGSLLAMYEHRVFVQAVIWDINPFDQWGVELGKVLATEIISEIEGQFEVKPQHDSSTSQLISYYLANRDA